MDPEDRFLLCCVPTSQTEEEAKAMVQLASSGLKWPIVFLRALREGLAGLAYWHIRRCDIEDRVLPEALSALGRCYHEAIGENLAAMGSLRDLLGRFETSAVPVMVLKGAALVSSLYPGLGLRRMTDVDLLVRREDLRKADALLRGFGYAPVDGDPQEAAVRPVGYLSSLDYRRVSSAPREGGNERRAGEHAGSRKIIPRPDSFHLHWHLVNSSVPAYMFAVGVDMERLWTEADQGEVSGARFRMLAPHHLLIYLCEHALRVGHSFDRLVLFSDILEVLRVYGAALRWERVVAESVELGLHRFLFLSLSLVCGLFGPRVPEETLLDLQRKVWPIRAGERLFLRMMLSGHRLRGLSYLAYLSLNRGLGSKCRFMARTLFPPLWVLRQRSYDSEAKPGSLYAQRAAEVAMQAVRLAELMALGHRGP